MGDKRRISKDNYKWNGRDLNTGTRERLFPDNGKVCQVPFEIAPPFQSVHINRNLFLALFKVFAK